MKPAAPSGELMAAMGAFNHKLMAAGVMADGGGLKPTSQGARVAFDGAQRTVKPGRSESSANSPRAIGSGR